MCAARTTGRQAGQALDYGRTRAQSFSEKTGTSIVDGVLSGVKWAEPHLTYAFPTDISQYHPYALKKGVEPATARQKEMFTKYIDEVSDYTNLTFSELTSGGDTAVSVREATIRIGNAKPAPGSSASAYYPHDNAAGGDIFMGPDNRGPIVGNWASKVSMHELGHALGLSHAFQNHGGFGTAGVYNGYEYTVMTHLAYEGTKARTPNNSFPQSYMMSDIAALQFMYGANFDHNAGNTIYSFDSNGQMRVNGRLEDQKNDTGIIFRTIWDGNGVDTYDFSNFDSNQAIDLAPGGWSDLTADGNGMNARLDSARGVYAKGHVYNALQYKDDARSLIENAKTGAGDDVIKGNRAANALTANDGNDRLYGYAGNDTLDGGDGKDVLDGGDGDDRLIGGANDDRINGGAGDDLILQHLLWARDVIDGGSGIDTLDYGRLNDPSGYMAKQYGIQAYLDRGYVNKAPYYGGMRDTVSNIENVTGTKIADYLGGNHLDNVLRGLDGDDKIVGHSGNDQLFGDTGNDTLYGSHGHDRLFGGTGNDTLYGGSGNDNLDGGDGKDVLHGESGNDRLIAGSNDDRIFAGAGNDLILQHLLWEKDVIDGGTGTDTIDYSQMNDPSGYMAKKYGIQAYLDRGFINKAPYYDGIPDRVSNVENVTGTKIADYIRGNQVNNVLRGLAGDDTLDGGSGHDTLTGDAGNDRLYGSAGNDSLDGGDGKDVIEGGDGHDRLIGGSNDDRISAGSGNDLILQHLLWEKDVIDGGAGTDTIDYSQMNDPSGYMAHKYGIQAHLERGIIYKAPYYDGMPDRVSNVENVTGTKINDHLGGNNANNVLRGLDGNDRLVGLGGNDLLHGDGGNDNLDGGTGNDRLYGGAGNDRLVGLGGNDLLHGDAGNDNLDGGAGNDTLYGGAGNDRLQGGGGNDLLYGGSGSDVFVFTTSGRDTGTASIQDFQRGLDKIAMSGAKYADGSAINLWWLDSNFDGYISASDDGWSYSNHSLRFDGFGEDLVIANISSLYMSDFV
ncbi:Ca2+-binding protein, RTX toxin-related [Paracoccus isoporae]|uniref:Ca2+-binding protein, RTX toxin-related n=1 Tax=Paracoccus isoporae TaxID=591205 RepID=A0A1G6WTJ3_9RHOB|nr:M10 family metallopeptidase C-terminal domain-containing protein [Paracoccus isoporae]SDD68517.1 Ca2+-binding protein, RTX toxin-related [Paracoccus isoporae]